LRFAIFSRRGRCGLFGRFRTLSDAFGFFRFLPFLSGAALTRASPLAAFWPVFKPKLADFCQKPQFGFFSAQKMCFLDLKLLKNCNSNLLFAIFPCVLQPILAVFPAKIAAFPQSPRRRRKLPSALVPAPRQTVPPRQTRPQARNSEFRIPHSAFAPASRRVSNSAFRIPHSEFPRRRRVIPHSAFRISPAPAGA